MKRTPEMDTTLPNEGIAALNALDYTQDFAREVACPDTTFAYLSAMHIMPQDEHIREMHSALMDLLNRKGPASAVMIVDAFNRMMPDDFNNTVFNKEVRERFKEARKLFYEFRDAGGTVIETSPPTWINYVVPHIGRNHTKGAGVFKKRPDGTGDAVTYKGGVNAYYPGVVISNDLMVKIPGLEIGQTFLGITNALAHNRYNGPKIRQLTPDLGMAIDTPQFPGDAPTLWSQYGMAGYEDATGIDFTSQYVPDPIMATQFARQVRRGATVRVLLPPEDSTSFTTLEAKINYARLQRMARRYPSLRILHSNEKYVHSKYMAVHTGRTAAPEFTAFGSSNGVYSGGLACTIEEMMFSSNATLNERLAGVVQTFMDDAHEARL